MHSLMLVPPYVATRHGQANSHGMTQACHLLYNHPIVSQCDDVQDFWHGLLLADFIAKDLQVADHPAKLKVHLLDAPIRFLVISDEPIGGPNILFCIFTKLVMIVEWNINGDPYLKVFKWLSTSRSYNAFF